MDDCKLITCLLEVSEDDNNKAPPILQHHFKNFDANLFLQEAEAQVANIRIRNTGVSMVNRETMPAMEEQSALMRTDRDDPVWSLKVQVGFLVMYCGGI